ncbi:hypothetical protein CCP1ISM_90030 [Azospirillaceae bacterium]
MSNLLVNIKQRGFMKYSDESLNGHVKAIVDSYTSNNKTFTEDLLEDHLENYYSNNPLPIENRPSMWMNVSNLLEKHYELRLQNS